MSFVDDTFLSDPTGKSWEESNSVNVEAIKLDYLFQSICEETNDPNTVVHQWRNAEELRLVKE